MVIYQGIHGGSLPKSESFVAVNVPEVIVTAIKQAENGEELIVRCVETSGIARRAILSSDFANLRWEGDFSPGEIKTLRVNRVSGSIKEVNLLEE